ncbi:LysE family transporter [Aquimarina sp. ERC-38]|uniref:LysE family translocator n=1 Tax=Aquimarina sp. ERC-38 TaxID=2949996 RepID=UPI0022451339|nr:LysE family transporter [Aquimarina sp. ERC-38]UZO81578.1 LysE family transporter [Aquimarina sp. ERC-38]
MEVTKFFLITYFASLLGVLPPGLVNMTVAKTCVERGKHNGLLVAIGATLVVFIQACIAILLAKYIFFNPYVRNILLRTGAVIFLLLSIYFFVKARQKNIKIRTYKHAHTQSFFKGAMVSLLNILPIPYFCAIAAAMSVSNKVDYDAYYITVFSIAAGLGTFTSLYLYVLSFLKIENRTASITKYSNYFMAFLMLILVVITVVRIFTDVE